MGRVPATVEHKERGGVGLLGVGIKRDDVIDLSPIDWQRISPISVACAKPHSNKKYVKLNIIDRRNKAQMLTLRVICVLLSKLI